MFFSPKAFFGDITISGELADDMAYIKFTLMTQNNVK